MNYTLMFLGLGILIKALYDYFELTKDNKKNKLKKHIKFTGLLSIVVGVLYFALGVFLVLGKVSAQFAFIYVIIIVVLEILAKTIIKKEYE